MGPLIPENYNQFFCTVVHVVVGWIDSNEDWQKYEKAGIKYYWELRKTGDVSVTFDQTFPKPNCTEVIVLSVLWSTEMQ